jgi:hypothetical protein
LFHLRNCDGDKYVFQMTTAAWPRPRFLVLPQPGFLRSVCHGLCARCLFCFLLLLAFACSSSSGRVVVTSLPGFDGDLPFHLETGCACPRGVSTSSILLLLLHSFILVVYY